MKLIIGLGNPGDRYMNNRRNIGFKIVDVLANNTSIQIKTKKKKSLLGTGEFEKHEIVLLKPQTFMDLSGEAVLYIASFLRIPVSRIIVIHDDYSLPYGDVQVALGQSNIKHIGIDSITLALKSDKYVRIRIGIAPQGRTFSLDTDGFQSITNYLETDFTLDENMRIIEVINDAEAALRSILTQDINDVLSRYKLGTTTKQSKT
ncbi:MAG: aminoacyl-tRNA hydrolase [Spirochaetia bacterium]|nr:aminoacyl-tRNA hydrolase [Spirochaetia bacterium]